MSDALVKCFSFSERDSHSEHLQPNPGHVGQGLDFMLMASSEMTEYRPLFSFLC